MPLRRRARALALIVLYEVDIARHAPETCLGWAILSSGFPEETAQFARELISGALAHREELDRQIQAFAPAWPVSQLAVVDRNLLRLAIYEIAVDRRSPAKAAINEAVELAKLFGSESSPRFVNGVLGSVMDMLSHTGSGPQGAA
ncbi:MAG: transcription antitermination factor NusB [Chloroflexi bacterium]|nr:transcription antitermination factor NusB [Chloroflexota bacterium]